MPVCDDIVVVEKVDQASSCQRPSNISNNAWKSASGARIFEVNDARVLKRGNWPFGRAFRAIVYNNNFNGHA